MARFLRALLAAILFTTVVAAPTTANAQSSFVITQGDPIYIGYYYGDGSYTIDSRCTLGYNSVADHASLTAAHCTHNGDTVFVKSGYNYYPVGNIYAADGYQFFRHPSYGEFALNDQALIVWSNDVILGGNIYSTDAWVGDNGPVYMSDRVCFHGYTTHGDSKKYTCGPMMGIIRELAYAEFASQGGDSGGPVWIPNKGFLGVLSLGGTMTSSVISTTYTVASMYADSPRVVTESEENQLFYEYADYLRTNGTGNRYISHHTLGDGSYPANTPRPEPKPQPQPETKPQPEPKPQPQPQPDQKRKESSGSNLSSSGTTAGNTANFANADEGDAGNGYTTMAVIGILGAFFSLMAALAPHLGLMFG